MKILSKLGRYSGTILKYLGFGTLYNAGTNATKNNTTTAGNNFDIMSFLKSPVGIISAIILVVLVTKKR